MKVLGALMRTLAVVAGAANAQAGNVDDCHSLSDSRYGIWACQ
jgi:hypothetical protein